MAVSRKVQGRTVTDKDIKTIQSSIVSNPTWQRIRISQELCQLWNWKNDAGKPKVPIKSVWLYLLSPLYNILTSEGLQL